MSQTRYQNHTKKTSSQAPVKQRRGKKVLQDNRTSETTQRNKTGLPDDLKTGMESVSGVNLDDVKVHYNSAKPQTVQAHAFAQGKDIHLASGQESHLPHELGHVVQQAQGRVKPTTKVAGVAVNDNAGLEHEATAMGNAAIQRKVDGAPPTTGSAQLQNQAVAQLNAKDALALASELHPAKKKFSSMPQLTAAKQQFSRDSWARIVESHNQGLMPGQPKLRMVYHQSAVSAAPGRKGKKSYIGFGSDGKPFTMTTMEKVSEKLHSTIHTVAHGVVHHAPDLASTGAEIATHTIDVKALNTATHEFVQALKDSGGDLSAGDYRSFAVHLVDVAAGAVRSGASVAAVTHRITHTLETFGAGVPGISYLVKLTGDAMWYSAAYAKKKAHQHMDPQILKAQVKKRRLGKQD